MVLSFVLLCFDVLWVFSGFCLLILVALLQYLLFVLLPGGLPL